MDNRRAHRAVDEESSQDDNPEEKWTSRSHHLYEDREAQNVMENQVIGDTILFLLLETRDRKMLL